MEDKVSQDSLSVTDEFVLVPPSEGPSDMASSGGAGSVRSEEGLKIAGNGNMEELQHHLEEVLDERTASEVDDSCTDTVSSNGSYASSSSSSSYSKTDPSDGEQDPQQLSPSRQQMQNLESKVLNSHVHLDSPEGEEPSQGSNSDPWEPRSKGEILSGAASVSIVIHLEKYPPGEIIREVHGLRKEVISSW